MVMMWSGKANPCHCICRAMLNKCTGKKKVQFDDRPFKDGEVSSNGEDLSSNDKMSEDSDDDDNGSSGGGVRDKIGDNAEQWRRCEWQQ
jgi:hypothetical protein